MKRLLRHPINSIREPFGTAGLVVAIIALVAALGGTALAAKGALTGKQKKEVAKIAKKEAKKFANSNPGAAGTNGTNGTNGANGKEGPAGAAGAPGANGKSVVVKNNEPENCPEEEGVTYEVEASGSATEICNGEEGSPWTAGGTLPSGSTETGSWVTLTAPGTGAAFAALSFPIPLAAELDESHVVFIAKGATPGPNSGCAGGTAEEPTADEGFLCVFAAEYEEEPFFTSIRKAGVSTGATADTEGASTTGAILTVVTEEAVKVSRGTWAVTG